MVSPSEVQEDEERKKREEGRRDGYVHLFGPFFLLLSFSITRRSSQMEMEQQIRNFDDLRG